MNEALSRREIEDVLSSIRKLVSHAPERPGGAASGDDSAAGPAAGTLVLTSALRVADAPEAAAPPVSEQDTATVPEASLSEDMVSSPESAPELEDAAEVGTARTRAALDALRSTIGPAPDAAPESPDQPETGDSVSDSPVARESSIDDALEATLARLEQALSSSSQSSASAADQKTASGAAADGSDDPVIDEAMLYQIVAHIVRQELQGELGEKITRNIRKLVRAEVARELHLRNL